MTEQMVQWVTQQGLGAVLALVMFLIYRKDTQAHLAQVGQTVEAYMRFAQELGSAMTRSAEALARQGLILERLEQALNSHHLEHHHRMSNRTRHDDADPA